jgi:hypothetical protein
MQMGCGVMLVVFCLIALAVIAFVLVAILLA